MSKHHDTLQIKPGATKDEIKKAFRRLAVIHHPDKQGGSTQKFIEIKNAYDALMKEDGPIFGFDTGSTSGSGFWNQSSPNSDMFNKAYEEVFRKRQQARQQTYHEAKTIFDLQVRLRKLQNEIDEVEKQIRDMKSQESHEDYITRMRRAMGL